MHKQPRRALCLFLTVLFLLPVFPAAAAVDEGVSLPSLYKIYENDFLMGCIFSGYGFSVSPDLSGSRFDLIKQHFNVLTAENAMKPSYMSPSKDSYSFTYIDKMSDILAESNIAFHGHVLAWHSQSAAWLNKTSSGAALTRTEAKANLEAFITAVASHYKGKLISWDVVNETFANSVGSVPSDWRDALRKNEDPWYAAYANGAAEGESGADYIYDAFAFARLADPSAVLYYNDYNETERGKREAIAMMVEDLNAQWKKDIRNTEPDRLLIEGIGMQSHFWTDSLNVNDVESTIKRFIETGAEISVSELDIPSGNWNGYKDLSAEQEKKQAALYAQVFQIYKKYADNISRVTIWGLDDPYSWRSQGSPLLFDKDLNAKEAFFAVADPDGYLAGEYDDTKTRAAVLAAKAAEWITEEPDEPDEPGETPDEPDSLDSAAPYAKEYIIEAIGENLVPEQLQNDYAHIITRAEFCALAAQVIETATGDEITARAEFTDTDELSVEKLGGLGVVKGIGGGKFNPDGQFTRIEVAVILVQIAEYFEMEIDAGTATYTDINAVQENYSWAVGTVLKAKAAGLFNGDSAGNLLPETTVDRQQAILAVLNLYNIMN